MRSSKVYRIVPKGDIKSMALKFENFYTNEKEKYIPSYVLNNTDNYRKFFFYGFYHADGRKDRNITYSQKSKITNSCLSYLVQSLGYSINMNSRIDKPNIFSNLINDKLKINYVKKIELISENKLNTVYDLSTETGNFNCGFPLIVKNTDSVILNINTEDLYEDLHNCRYDFDLCDYPKDHKSFHEQNKKVIGYPKDETNGEPIKELIAVLSKVYGYDHHLKIKGTSKSTIEKQITMDDLRHCIYYDEQLQKINYSIRSKKFDLFTLEQNKIACSPIDQKRYMINNIKTLPFCDEETKKEILNQKEIESSMVNILDNIC